MSKRMESAAAARWGAIVRDQAVSGLSVAAYCRRTRVPQASFYAWRRKLRDTERAARRPGGPAFAEVQVVSGPRAAQHVGDAGRAEAGALELHLRRGWCVIVRPGFDRPTLLDLVATLEHGVPPAGDDGRDVAGREAGA